MKFIALKEELLRSLGVVSKAVSAKTPLQILQSIKLTAKENVLSLYATDTEVCISDVCRAQVKSEGELIVSCRNLLDIVRAFPTQEICISKDEDDDQLHITGPGCEFTLLSKSVEEYPAKTKAAFSELVELEAQDFKAMIQKSAFACAAMSSNIALTGILVEFDEGMMTMVGVDGFKLSRRRMAVAYHGSVSGVVVPCRVMNEIAKVLPGQGKVCCGIEDKKFLVKFNGTDIVCNVLNCKFINFSPILNKTYPNEAKIERQAFLHACERALLLNEGAVANVVVLDFQPGSVRFSSVSSIGAMKEEVALKSLTSPIRIAFNPRYLIELIKAADDDVLTIGLIDPLSQICIKGQTGSYTYVLTPIRQSETMS